MYLSHYGLKTKPFQVNPDPKFFWLGESTQATLKHLRKGIATNRGLLSLVGDVGTGKTTLVNALVEGFADQLIVASISDPALEELDFLNLIANSFKWNKTFGDRNAFSIHLKEFLQKASSANKKVLLIIDEAQRLMRPIFDVSLNLTKIDASGLERLNVLYVAQNEFKDLIREPEYKALRQGIVVKCELRPLSENETEKYIVHRLRIAGAKNGIFTLEAIHEIYVFSGGYPRLINNICDLALLAGYVKKTKRVESRIIKACREQLQPAIHNAAAITKKPTSASRIIVRKNEQATSYKTGKDSRHLVVFKPWNEPTKPKSLRITLLAVVLSMAIIIPGYFYGVDTPLMLLKSYWKRATSPNQDSSLKMLLGLISPVRNTSESYNSVISSAIAPPPIQSPQSTEFGKSQSKTPGLQDRLAQLEKEKIIAETQTARLESEHAALRELQSAQARVAEIERLLAEKDQALTQSQSALATMATELAAHEKQRDLLQAEIASGNTVLADLKAQLASTRTEQRSAEDKAAQSQTKIDGLQDRLAQLEKEKAAAETQSARLKSEHAALAPALEELKSAQARVAEIERLLAEKDQALSQSQSALATMATELAAHEKQRDLLQAEIASGNTVLADLKEQLASTRTEQRSAEDKAAQSQTKIDGLQERLAQLGKEKAAAETRAARLESQQAALAPALKELKSAQARIAETERLLAEKDQALSQSQSTLATMATELAAHEKQRDLLQAEIASRDTALADLKAQLASTRTEQRTFKDEIAKNRIALEGLQAQLLTLIKEKTPATTPSVAIKRPAAKSPQRLQKDSGFEASKEQAQRVPADPASRNDLAGEDSETPAPSAIIDWVLKKRSD